MVAVVVVVVVVVVVSLKLEGLELLEQRRLWVGTSGVIGESLLVPLPCSLRFDHSLLAVPWAHQTRSPLRSHYFCFAFPVIT